MTDPNRPDGDAERLVRIETRLVKYQQANAVALKEVADNQATIIKLLKEAASHGITQKA